MIWISTDDDSSLVLVSRTGNNNTMVKNGITITKVYESEAYAMKQFLHQKRNTCGGIDVHDSLEDALEHLSRLENADRNQKAYKYSINNQLQVEELFRSINANNLWRDVEKFKSMQTRRSVSNYNLEASNKILWYWWSKVHWDSLSMAIDISYYHHIKTDQPSVVLTIPGKEEMGDTVILGAHLDSKNGRFGDHNARAPGADDNASGLALLTECLRVILKTKYRPRKTIKLIAFAAEEEFLLGSKEMAADYLKRKENVVGMLNLDMSGFKGSARDIYLVKDNTNTKQNEFLEALMSQEYMRGITHGYTRCGYACSDHVSWHVNGFPASMAFESKFDEHNPVIHTSRDTHVNQRHMKNFIKLALAYIAELAKTSA
jgi:leucyl aminopeptidase